MGRKSYHVTYNGPYSNNRVPHVETEIEYLTGKTYKLGKRERVLISGRSPRLTSEACSINGRHAANVAICYEVIGLTNEDKPAHITVYFGKVDGSDKY